MTVIEPVILSGAVPVLVIVNEFDFGVPPTVTFPKSVLLEEDGVVLPSGMDMLLPEILISGVGVTY